MEQKNQSETTIDQPKPNETVTEPTSTIKVNNPKKPIYKKSFIWILVALAVIGAVGFFVFSNNNSVTKEYNTYIEAPGQIVKVETILSTDALDSASVSFSGNADTVKLDERISLDVPQNTAYKAITVTKITSMSGLPDGWELVTGFDFSPDGLVLANSAQANVPVSDTANLVAYKIEQGALVQVPYLVKDGTAQVPITSFSGLAFIRIVGEVPSVSNANDIESKAKELVANIVKENNESVSDAQLSRIYNVLHVWYETSIKPHLNTASTNSDTLKDSIREFNSWRSYVQIFGQEDKFQTKVTEAHDLIAKGLANAVDQAVQKCTAENDATQIAVLSGWRVFAQALGLEQAAGITNEKIDNLIKECGQFKFTMTSTMVTKESTAKATAEGNLSINDNGSFVGSGSIRETDFAFNSGGSPCTVPAPDFPFTMPETKLSTSTGDPGSSINLVLDVSEFWNHEPTYTCVDGHFTFTELGYVWMGDFDAAHAAEVSFSNNDVECLCYTISDWEYVGSPTVFAQKIYSRNINNVQENTVFTLGYTD